MAKEASKYTSRPFGITPFGVDMNLFSPAARDRIRGDGQFVVGTVKTLTRGYGIDRLLRASRLLLDRNPDVPLKIRIAGRGREEAELKALCHELGLAGRTCWLGQISQEAAVKEWANMDIAVIPSLRESFGVSAIEAQACARPVIVSDAPGLLESTAPGTSSIVVNGAEVNGLALAMETLYLDAGIRAAMGAAGRRFVSGNFELSSCFRRVEELYEESIA